MIDEGPQVSDTTTDVNSPEAIASMVTLGVIGAMGTFTFLPMVVGTAVDDLGFTSQQAGLLASADRAPRQRLFAFRRHGVVCCTSRLTINRTDHAHE